MKSKAKDTRLFSDLSVDEKLNRAGILAMQVCWNVMLKPEQPGAREQIEAAKLAWEIAKPAFRVRKKKSYYSVA